MEFLWTFKFLKVAALSALIFVLLDLLWIAVIAAKMYADELGYLSQIDQGKVVFNLPVGLLVQVIISLGLTVIISIGLQVDDRLWSGIFLGAFTGFVIYFTYDFTNLSFVKGWPLWVSIVDVAWGTLQGIFAGIYVYYLHQTLS